MITEQYISTLNKNKNGNFTKYYPAESPIYNIVLSMTPKFQPSLHLNSQCKQN